MGAFDDAIREHLELKRRQGASEEDLKREEEEALGKGAVRFARPEPTAEEPDAGPAPERTETPVETPETSRAVVTEPDEVALESRAQPAPPPAAGDELEPDEVLPDEALEPSVEEDLLEETPEFLEESPDQDRLWFEQRAPKDFDFGD